jgi:DNA-binding CsgD family transcriptional regulator
LSSTIEDNKLKNRNQQQQPTSRSKPGQTTTVKTTTPTSASPTQTFKKGQEDNNNGREEGRTRTKRRRLTKVGLNDTLRHIRYLIVKGRSNSEIQNILQLEERTFYRYMAKIYEMDQALFAEEERKTLATEFGILKDRLLKSYRWYIAMADNENMKPDIRMEAQRDAIDIAFALLELEREGPKTMEQAGRRFLERIYQDLR